MTALRCPLALLLTLAATAVSAESVFLSSDDLFFAYRPVIGGRGLCGFQIRGNHRSKKIPRAEWDINIDEIVAGDIRIAGISAGAFNVLSNDRTGTRQPRAPITAFSFVVRGSSDAIAAKIVGSPNAFNAVRGMIDAEPAAGLFKAFYTGQLITISLTYQDATTDSLQLYGMADRRKFGGGQNNYFAECLRGLAPYTNSSRPIP